MSPPDPRRGKATAGTAANAQTHSTTLQHDSTFTTEILPRLRFIETVAVRGALELDGIAQADSLIAIAKTASVIELHAKAVI